MSAFGNVSSLDLQRIWDGVHGRAVHGERITLGVIELDPNSVVPEHSHEHEQLGMVIRGQMDFRVGDERRVLGPGGTWRIPSNTPHEATAGPEGAVVIDVFAPTRADFRDMEPLAPRAPRWPD